MMLPMFKTTIIVKADHKTHDPLIRTGQIVPLKITLKCISKEHQLHDVNGYSGYY